MNLNLINEKLRNNERDKALQLSSLSLQKLFGTIVPISQKSVRVKLLSNWCSAEEMFTSWGGRMSQDGNGKWNSIQLVLTEPIDYYVVINRTDEPIDKKRTILFQMEPNMKLDRLGFWGEWADPNPNEFLRVFKHTTDLNNLEWHLSTPYTVLKEMRPIEKTKALSTIVSGKYWDIGQVKRIEFIQFLERNSFPVDVYGTENPWNLKNYRGSLPPCKKDDGLFPYKYTLAVENNPIPNYVTEKLVDGILAECLVFYSGCPNVCEYIDSRAFVQLELSNFEADMQLMKKAIDEDWYTQRLTYIREAKKKILDTLQFFPRLESVIQKTLFS